MPGIKIGDRVRIYAPAMRYQRMAGTVTEIFSSYIRLAMDKETKTIYSKFINSWISAVE
ncbi:MAG TPA: hypothetical protein VJ991_09050 [Balneolales bacterium]|nr:hypothetical protein [Balneolales bacterium]